MRLVTFSHPSTGEAVGAVLGDSVYDLSAASGRDPAFDTMLSFLQAGPKARAKADRLLDQTTSDPEPRSETQGFRHPLDAVHLHAPIPRPAKNVFCVGLNYRSHVEQNAAALGQPFEIPDIPLFFSKPVTAVVGPGAPIVLDRRLTASLDYEVELAVVIGTGGTWIEPEDALAHVFGFTLVNDVSARDLQFRTSQFFYGKGLDSYCPMGPAITSIDEMPPLESVMLELLVNGDLRQSEAAGNMLFSPAMAIAELSKGITLEPGDVISLGTPGGCGYQMTPATFLEPGDVVECRASGIGSLTNTVADAGTTG